jgi:bifunctional UDP-N-acetylglucosamine pyrophosphorylase/glucosamine-1-phosphate N-acetyltransferase
MNAPHQPAKGTGRGLTAIILAAGQSTRMKTATAKVMHPVCGRPMLAYVIDACRAAGAETIHVVVGFAKECIVEAFSREPGIRFIEQREQKGTGHAVSMCADALGEFEGDCIVIAGDMPLIRSETLADLVGGHRSTGAAASLVTTHLADPAGYGRILREADGAFEAIVEHRDCTAGQLAIQEVNPSYYCFDAAGLFESLKKVTPNNAKGEYYLTEVLSILKKGGQHVRAATILPAEDATGVNSRAELAAVNRLMQQRILAYWMEQGVTIIDPASTWIDSPAQIGADTVLMPFSYVEGAARIGSGCRIGPFAYVGSGARVEDGAAVGPGALTAFDATTPDRRVSPGTSKRTVQISRRPPAQSGVS